MPGGGELPRKYSHTYDLFVALTAAAAATSRLRIGSGVCLVIEHDPIITAKEVASVDHLSGGRFEFGVGAGWNREEMSNHGTDPRTRMRVLSERIEAMKAIWTRTRRATTASSSTSTASGPGPSRRSVRTRRCSSAATARPCSSACSRTGTPGFRTTRGADTLERAAELRARAERPIELQVISVPAEPKDLEALEQAGCARACHWLPSGNRRSSRRRSPSGKARSAQFTGEA